MTCCQCAKYRGDELYKENNSQLVKLPLRLKKGQQPVWPVKAATGSACNTGTFVHLRKSAGKGAETKTMRNTFTWLAVFFAFCSKAQTYPAVTIPGSEVRKISSSIVTGQEYELQILLPGGYAGSNKKYPVVYLMDSQWDFPLVKSIYGQQYYDGFIPEVIIVGVTWGGSKPNPDSLRVRDYTPTNDGRAKQGGQADQFLRFMKEELFPFVEKNYKTDPAQRTLMGCSLGGLFTMYALFTHSDMFSGYVAASPAIGWDREVLYRYEQQYFSNTNNPPARLYMTIGDVERNAVNFEKMTDHLQNRHYTNLSMRSKILENTGHSGTKSETYTRGLQFVFQKPDIKVEEKKLAALSGTYKSLKGGSIELSVENYQLVLYAGAANRFPLKAATETSFYSNAEFLNMVFSADGKTVQVNRYGNSDTFSKQ